MKCCKMPFTCLLIIHSNSRAQRKHRKTPNAGRRLAVTRRIIESSESEENSGPHSQLKYAAKQSTKKHLTGEIIELTSSSDERGHSIPQGPRTSPEKVSQENFPPYLMQKDDGAILIL